MSPAARVHARERAEVPAHDTAVGRGDGVPARRHPGQRLPRSRPRRRPPDRSDRCHRLPWPSWTWSRPSLPLTPRTASYVGESGRPAPPRNSGTTLTPAPASPASSPAAAPPGADESGALPGAVSGAEAPRPLCCVPPFAPGLAGADDAPWRGSRSIRRRCGRPARPAVAPGASSPPREPFGALPADAVRPGLGQSRRPSRRAPPCESLAPDPSPGALRRAVTPVRRGDHSRPDRPRATSAGRRPPAHPSLQCQRCQPTSLRPGA